MSSDPAGASSAARSAAPSGAATPLLVVTAHPGDSVWRAAGAIALTTSAGGRHLWEYYTDLGRRRGVPAKRNSGPNLSLASETWAEAYQRAYPHVTTTLA